MRSLKVFVFVALMLIGLIVQGYETAGRSWNYLSLTFSVNRSFSWLVQGGLRHEFTRISDDMQIATKGIYMNEFFTGPIYVKKLGPVVGVFPLFFYRMGFPIKSLDLSTKSYSIEFAPTFITRFGKLTLSNRFIFHNKIYNNFYSEVMAMDGVDSGYSLLLRWRIMLQYPINRFMTLEIAEEPFIGLIEEDGAPAVTGPGFSEKGLDMNRIYAGIVFKLPKDLSLIVDYVYETSYAEDDQEEKQLTQKAHYIFLTLKAKFSFLLH